MKGKSLKIIISILLVLLSYGFIIYKIVSLEELKKLTFSNQNFQFFDFGVILILILLMFLNWSLETIKWKILVDKIQQFSFFNAFQAIFSGITIGIFTPNRLGEIGGRIMFMDKGKRTFGVIAAGVGSLAQFITTIISGIIGLVLLLAIYPDKFKISPLLNSISSGILFILFLFLIWSYFNVNKVKPILFKFSFFRKRADQLDSFSEIKTVTLIRVAILSFSRYLVFMSQFFILLCLFDIYLTYTQAYISISLIYLFATLIPTSTLIELGIRGSLAIFFIGFFSENVLGIVLSTSILWIINLAIPAIIGSIFLLKKSSNKN